jgi:uncharacterized protein (TIGR03435 family)
MKLTTISSILIWAAFTAFAQAPAPSPSFEVASIRPAALGSSRQTSTERERGFAGVGGRVELRGITMGELLLRAFDLRPNQLSGPSWLNTQAYDISAVAPAGTPKEKVLLMFRNLLADRFKLKYQRETATGPVYALVAGPNGVKLQLGIPDDDPENLGQIGTTAKAAGPGAPVTAMARAPFGVYKLTVADGVMRYEFQNISMRDFTEYLSLIGARALGLPVVDATEMTGRYQIAIDITQSEIAHQPVAGLPEGQADAGQAPGASDPSGSSLRASLDKHGLRLVRRNVPLEKFRVDQLEKTPTEN